MPRSRLLAFCLLVHAAPLTAQIWTEVGDAGDLRTNAQIPIGTSNLTSISGSIGFDDVDVYLIQVSDTATFQASTVGGAAFDTQLFLFDQDGMPVTHNDDAPGGGQQSRITGQFLVAPGRYYLAITKYGRVPWSKTGPFWLATPNNVERRPDSVGRFDPLEFWAGTTITPGGAYTIALTGATFPAREIVLPPNHHLSETANQTNGSVEYFRSAPSGRFQFVYNGSHLTDGGLTFPVQLTRMQLRGEDTEQNPGLQVYQNVTVRVGSTSLTENTIGTSFANNLSPATTTMSLAALIAFKTVKPCAGTAPNNYAFDIDLQAIGATHWHDPTGPRPNIIVDLSWPNAGPGPTGSNTIPVQDATGGPAVTRGRGLTAPSDVAPTGTLIDPPVVAFEIDFNPTVDRVRIPARVESIGDGCGGSASGFHQLFPHNQRFDIGKDLGGMTLTPDVYPSPNFYTVTAGAPPVDLTKINPFPNSTTEDFVVPHLLAAPLSYPGGSTTIIRMDDNGLVRLDNAPLAGNNQPTLAKWLGTMGEGARLAPLWSDFSAGRNVTTHPFSGMHVRNDMGVCWCTWLNVGRGNTAPVPGGQSVNTMQCVLFPSTGVVQFRYGQMSEIQGSNFGGSVTGITGFTRGMIGGVPSIDPGSIDLSRELPITTGPEGTAGDMWLSAVDVVPPVPSNMPGRMFPGNAIRWNVANVPPGSLFGAQMLDLTALQPGLHLPGLMGPGCQLSLGINPVFVEVFAAPGPTVNGTVPFLVPSGFDGYDVYSQFVAVKPNPIDLQLFFSQGMRHRLGRQ